MVKSVVKGQLDKLVGKEVWFRSTLNDVNSGIIMCVKGEAHAQIWTTGRKHNITTHAHANDIYETKDDLLAANHERFLSQISTYKREITDIVTLVKFCYDHPVAERGDQVDYAARAAARERAKELLGVEIDPVTAEMEKKLEKHMDPDNKDGEMDPELLEYLEK